MRYVQFLLLMTFFSCILLVQPGNTQEYSLKEITPQVQTALEARKARYNRIQELKQSGIIGENNKGYVSALESNNAARQIVDEENQNRRVIYYAIAEQNGLEGKEEIVEKVFAEIKREKASSGEMIQLPTGDWVKQK